MSDIGHNSIDGAVKEKLKQIVAKVEKINEERDELLEHRRDTLAEAKGMGFDVKAINAVIRRRKKSRDEIEEEEQILALYENALGV